LNVSDRYKPQSKKNRIVRYNPKNAKTLGSFARLPRAEPVRGQKQAAGPALQQTTGGLASFRE